MYHFLSVYWNYIIISQKTYSWNYKRNLGIKEIWQEYDIYFSDSTIFVSKFLVNIQNCFRLFVIFFTNTKYFMNYSKRCFHFNWNILNESNLFCWANFRLMVNPFSSSSCNVYANIFQYYWEMVSIRISSENLLPLFVIEKRWISFLFVKDQNNDRIIQCLLIITNNCSYMVLWINVYLNRIPWFRMIRRYIKDFSNSRWGCEQHGQQFY